MAEKIVPSLDNVPETLLMTLAVRAKESQRKDALLMDDHALAIMEKLDYDFSRLKLRQHDETSIILRTRKIDALISAFLARSPSGAVIHAGCGLDTRFERVDNGQVEWFDIDLPEVMELRQRLLGGDGLCSRYHLLSTSILGEDWILAVLSGPNRPCLFVAEGVLPYFEVAQVRRLVLKIRDCFPGAELVCDAYSPFTIWADNLQLAYSRMSARMHWGMKDPHEVEAWGKDIRLLEKWYFFDEPQTRWGAFRLLRFTPMAKSAGIFHFWLGSCA